MKWLRGSLSLTGVELVYLVGVCIVSVVIFTRDMRGLIFFFDEWSFVSGREFSLQGVLEPHNGHLSVLPVLTYLGLRQLFGLGSYVPYQVVGLVVHAVTVLVVYFVVRRRSPTAAMVVAPVFMLFGSGWQNILWPFQIGMMGALAFGLLAIDEASRDNSRPRLLGWVSGSLLCAGGGVAALVTVVAILFFRRTWNRLAQTLGVSVLYGVWYLVLGTSQSVEGNANKVPAYVYDSARAVMMAFTPNTILDPRIPPVLIAVALAVWGARRPAKSDIPLMVALMFFIVTTWVLTGLSRAHLNEPGASRYLYVGAAVTLVIVGLLLSKVGQLSLLLFAAALWPISIIPNIEILRSGSSGLRDNGLHVKAAMTALDLSSRRPELDGPVEPSRAPQLLISSYDEIVSQNGPLGFKSSELAAASERHLATLDITLERIGVQFVSESVRECAGDLKTVTGPVTMRKGESLVLRPNTDIDVVMRRFTLTAEFSNRHLLTSSKTYLVKDFGSESMPALVLEFPQGAFTACIEGSLINY